MAGHTIILVHPSAEIDQLAPFRAERPPRIILPFNLLSTHWTNSHASKVRRKRAKVKAGIIVTSLFPNRRVRLGVEYARECWDYG